MGAARHMSNHFEKPDEETMGHLRASMEFLQAFRSLEPTMPLSYALAFLAVAADPGNGTVHYAKQLGMHQPVASRILLEMGQKTRTGGPGLELLDSVYDTVDLRLKRYHLTPKGRVLLGQINKIMSRRRAGESK